MHPTVYQQFAEERITGFRREADARRLAAMAKRPQRPTIGGRRPRSRHEGALPGSAGV